MNECFYASYVTKNGQNELVQKKRIKLESEMTHIQILGEFGLMIPTESQVLEFFSGSILFEFNQIKGQIKGAAVN